MKRISKVSLTLVLVLILAVVAAIVYVVSNLDFIVERLIEQEGSRVTKTAVSVERVNIGLRQGRASIAGIKVANPSGFEFENGFSLEQISTRIDIGSLRGSPIVIDHVTVAAPAVFFEVTKDRKINLNVLKENIAGKGPRAASDDATKGEQTQLRVLIRRLSMKNGTLVARLAPLEDRTRELRLPAIEFTDLGGTDGATPAELSRQILNKLIARVRDEIRKQGWETQLDEYKRRAGEKLEQEKQKLKSETEQRLEQEKQEAEEKLKNLLRQ